MRHEPDGPAGVVFDIQQYCVYDGPGIRTGVFFKGCPMRCFWCHNPESQKPQPQLRFIASRCDGCGRCVDRCAPKAIRLRRGTLEWETGLCNHCGDCADSCAEKALVRAGEVLTVAQAVERATVDREFFAGSGGGVTVSGGEPTLQSEYLLRVLRSLRERGLHTAIETCGQFPADLLSSLLETVDLFLFDLKQIDDRKHREGTGCSNRQIHDNFRTLLARAGAERTTVRIPLIPGFNTSEADISAFARFLKEAGYHGEVHLMPYHGWAKSKYESLGRLRDYRDLSKTEPSDTDRIIGQFAARGLATRIYG